MQGCFPGGEDVGILLDVSHLGHHILIVMRVTSVMG